MNNESKRTLRSLLLRSLLEEQRIRRALHIHFLVLLLGLMLGTSLAQESRATLEGRVIDQTSRAQ